MPPTELRITVAVVLRFFIKPYLLVCVFFFEADDARRAVGFVKTSERIAEASLDWNFVLMFSRQVDL